MEVRPKEELSNSVSGENVYEKPFNKNVLHFILIKHTLPCVI